MIVNDKHRLVLEDGENFKYGFVASPNISSIAQSEERALVIHAPPSRTVSGAASLYTVKPRNILDGRSKHLILGRDGREIVQMVPFDKGAMHTFGYNGRSIAIELQYPGELVEKAPQFDKTNKMGDDQYILASPLSSSRYGDWSLYPKAQLDLLLKVATTLSKHYRITDVLGYDEIASRPDPGPAFPMIQFREKVLGVTNRSFILQETTRAVRLLGQPGNENSLLTQTKIPRGTPVSILNERFDWYLISVIADVGENPWLTGWVEKRAVRAKTDFELKVSEDHYLATLEGRRFQEIAPHRNGFEASRRNDNPKYIVMHFTTGTRLESTISHFKDPHSGVSTHLLIGRDGRVVQFLPFNYIAHHCGYSWWERQHNLNNFSIGIELDNAGLLSRGEKGKWFSRKIEIPGERVQQEVHWKQYTPNKPSQFPGWEIFPDAQLRVALNIVKALKMRYPSIEEILGHDDVNLRNRYDPGPLFPMPKFRKALFGRKEPGIRIFTINQKTSLYTNIDGRLPNTHQKLHDESLPKNSIVNVIRIEGDLALVNVIKTKTSSLSQMAGWIRINSLTTPSGKPGKRSANRKKDEGKKTVDQRLTARDQEFFKRTKDGQPPTPVLDDSPFPAGTRVRIQQIRGEWTLVVVLDRVKGRSGQEGWLPTEFLSPEVIL